MQHFFKNTLIGALGMLLLAGFSLNAQEVHISTLNPPADGELAPPSNVVHSQPNYAGPDAMWDIQFDYAIGDSAGLAGMAAVTYLNGTYWVSRWATDTLLSFNANGSVVDTFKIDNGGTPLGGTRAMTTVGNYIYIANNTTTIYKVNPATRSVVRTFNTPALAGGTQGIRFITWDPTADGGKGGFWVGNFTTEINQIDTSGTVLNSIPTTTHLLGGMYGAAFDGTSTDGPYLWVFQQSAGPSAATISLLSLDPSALGTPVGVNFDVDADIGGGGDLAGGLFITDQIVPGKSTLGGLLQGAVDHLFGYELDFAPIGVDAGLAMTNQPLFGQVPEKFISGIDVIGQVTNFGTQALNTVNIDVAVDSNGTNVYSDNTTLTNIPRFGNDLFNIGPFTPSGQGAYTVDVSVSLTGQTDENPANDNAGRGFIVSDSVFALDDDQIQGSYGVGAGGTPAWVLVMYDIPQNGYLKAVEVELGTRRLGDTTYAVLVATDANGIPTGAPVAAGAPVLIDTAVGKYYLPLPVSFPVSQGERWGIGVYQANLPTGNIGIATSVGNFTPGINYFGTDGLNWTASGVANVRHIRGVVASCSIFGVATATTPDAGTGDGTATATPSNATGTVSYLWKDAAGNTVGSAATATGLAAGTYSILLSDMNGCSFADSVDVPAILGIDDLRNAGISQFELYPNPTKGLLSYELSFAQPENFEIALYTLQGKMLMSKSFEASLSSSDQFDLSEQAAGVYMLKITTDKGSAYEKVVLTR